MEQEFLCTLCNKKFGSEDALSQHNLAKHNVEKKEEKMATSQFNVGKYKWFIFAILIILAIVYFTFLQPKPFYQPKERVEQFKGLANASVTIIEFSDFQCPACQSAYPEVKRVLSLYSDRVKFVYKHFPLTNIHPLAFKAAEAAECAADQGKFWELHDKIFESKQLSVNDLKRHARELNLDTKLFDACLDSGAMSERVKSDMNEGNRRAVAATPTFFINNKPYQGVLPFSSFRQVIEEELLQ